MPVIMGKPPNYTLVFARIHYYYSYIPRWRPENWTGTKKTNGIVHGPR